jgi:hypothetical protein
VLLVPAVSDVENFPGITHDLTIDAVGGLASLASISRMEVPDGGAGLIGGNVIEKGASSIQRFP